MNPSGCSIICCALLLATVGQGRAQDQAPEAPKVSQREITVAAEPAIDEGFRMRGSSLSGSIAPGESLAVRQQLFKGNEYIFLLLTRGDVPEGEEIGLSVRDGRGNAVHVGRVAEDNLIRIRVNPPKTGVYVIVFSLPDEGEAPAGWRLAYGFR